MTTFVKITTNLYQCIKRATYIQQFRMHELQHIVALRCKDIIIARRVARRGQWLGAEFHRTLMKYCQLSWYKCLAQPRASISLRGDHSARNDTVYGCQWTTSTNVTEFSFDIPMQPTIAQHALPRNRAITCHQVRCMLRGSQISDTVFDFWGLYGQGESDFDSRGDKLSSSDVPGFEPRRLVSTLQWRHNGHDGASNHQLY